MKPGRMLCAMIAGGLSAISYAAPVAHTDYAVLFSGGGDPDNNRPRYYNQTLRMWDITTGILGFDPKNVYVLFADGLDPAADHCTDEGGIAGNPCPSQTYRNSVWDRVVNAGGAVLDATRDSLFDTLDFLDQTMTTSDSFYFWSFDHGFNQNKVEPFDPKSGGLVAWGEPGIWDHEFAGWVDFFDVKAEIYAFGQCFSGSMVDDLDLAHHANRFAAWAAAGCEPSWGDGWVDAWADAIESGVRWTHELGQYAIRFDPFGPNGLGLENPGEAGRNIHIMTNQIPEPGGLGVLALIGLVVVVVGRAGKSPHRAAGARNGRPVPGSPPLPSREMRSW